jgi:Sap, sulfolipid-1-addressing protein
MLAVAILVASLGIVDSLNPVTILVAVYLGSTREPRRRLTGFVIGVFSVYLVGGLVLVLGSGELSDKALAGVDPPGADFVALAAGAAAMILASLLWVRRRRWGRPRLPDRALHPGSTLALGCCRDSG